MEHAYKSCDDRTWQYNALTKTLNTEFYASSTFHNQLSIQPSFYFVTVRQKNTRVDENYIYLKKDMPVNNTNGFTNKLRTSQITC